MKIIIDNHKFDYDKGCRLLKLKYDKCPFSELNNIWDDIKPFTFKDIAKFENVEERRVGIGCLGLERLIKEVKPELLDKKTLKKSTSWVNEDGSIRNFKFKDTYELYKVKGNYFNEGLSKWDNIADSYFVKCKDTSTDRDYFIWVDLREVYNTNANNDNDNIYHWNYRDTEVNAIQAIAWTIQTDIPKGYIEKIVRQGDCILIKPKNGYDSEERQIRHLTEKEYKELLVAES
jgi:hypothetical protein